MDRLTHEQRRKNMQSIRASGSAIETALGKALWKRGFRYRKNYTQAEGKPDFAFVRERVAVFADSEFWHGYDWETRREDLKSNAEFWTHKIEANMRRDEQVNEILHCAGWTVIRFWGRAITDDPDACAERVGEVLLRKREKTEKH
jgi:DNA mismatch endonuclease Vsr